MALGKTLPLGVLSQADPGVPGWEVWVVSPSEQRVYVHTGRDAVRVVVAPAELETPLVPGWKLSLATLFRAATP